MVPKSVLEAIKMGIWDFEPLHVDSEDFDASNVMPGTKEKLKALVQRAESGLPLWHHEDRDDMEAPLPARKTGGGVAGYIPVSEPLDETDTAESDERSRHRVVERERDNEDLRVQNELLKSRVTEARRTAARETQRYDQLAVRNDNLQTTLDNILDRLNERAKANDALQAALIARDAGQLRMFEWYEGVVKESDADHVVAVYEVKDDLVEQTYLREQFIDGKLPEIGDCLAVYVHVAKLPPDEEEQPAEVAAEESSHEQRKRPKNVVPLPRTF